MKDAHSDSTGVHAAAARGKRRWALAALFVLHVALIVVMIPALIWLAEAIWVPKEAATAAWQDVQQVVSGNGPSFAQALSAVGRWVAIAWHDIFSDTGGMYVTFAAIGLLAAAPVAMMAPLVGPPAIATGGRSMRASVIGASVLASGLTCCVLVTLLELWYLVAASAAGAGSTGVASPTPDTAFLREPWAWCALWVVLGAIWAATLRAAGQTRDPNLVLRTFRWLLAGTALELALAVSTLAWARKRDNCICAWSSFWATVYGLTVLLLLCGPAVALLLSRRARLQWARLACRQCGYPRRTDSNVCSECGCAL